MRLDVYKRQALDTVLRAVYKDAPAAPDDKSYSVGGTVTDADGDPLPGVTVEMCIRDRGYYL